MERQGMDHIITTKPTGLTGVGIAGCTGRMGTALVRSLLAGYAPALYVCAGTVKSGFPAEGQDLGLQLGQAPLGVNIGTDPDSMIEKSDIIIDFTTPEATRTHLWLCAKHRKPLVIGTTGLREADLQEMHDAAQKTPIFYARNMSIGVNLLLALVEQCAHYLEPEWDIEIQEIHHRHKCDAPSGTALALGEAAAKGRGGVLSDFQVPFSAREGRTQERSSGDIGFSVIRGGNVAGEHTVFFMNEHERLELTHKASDRSIFARGALRAATWLRDQPAGLYNFQDMTKNITQNITKF